MTTPFNFHVLGSGSRGNATVVSFHDRAGKTRHLLIDLGLGPRTTRNRSRDIGIDLDQIEAAILTHGDSDHCTATWRNTLLRSGMPVYVAQPHVQDALRAGIPPANLKPMGGRIELASSLTIHRATAPHDREGTIAFRLEHHAHPDGVRSLGWATDLGRFVPDVEELLRGCDVVAIESNYDRQMQEEADRPGFLKRRIMNGHGHLSNHEAHQAILRLAGTSTPSAIVLLHLSQQCNCPRMLADFWSEHTPELAARLHITDQRLPLGPIEVHPAGPPLGQSPPNPGPVAQTLWS